jgi:uncharacterized membrane protein
MSDLDNVVVVSFEDDSKPYQALSALKSLTDQGRLTVNSAAVVQRDGTGSLHIGDGFDAETGEATAAGSLTGMLVGVLGGPIGVARRKHRRHGRRHVRPTAGIRHG